MTLLWTIIVVWLALQLPFAMLVGKSIKFGMRDPAAQRKRTQKTDRLPFARQLP